MRTMLLTTDHVIGAGSFVDCTVSSFKTCYGYNGWGGNPVRLITVPPDPVPHDDMFGPDPNAQGLDVGGWRRSNAAIQHTLQKSGWSWPTTIPIPDIDQFLADNYDLDRVIVFGGVSDKGSYPTNLSGLSITAEFQHSGDPVSGTWFRKADAPTGRYNSNFVLLPDGTIVAMGGQNLDVPTGPDLQYHDSTERFYPGSPAALGRWDVLAIRPPVAGYDFATPRRYHSVGLLLKDGAVALIGGRRDVGYSPGTYPDPEDTAEIYEPPYFFQGARPGLGSVPASIQYGVPFCVDTRDPAVLSHAVLMGIGAVTHHFDYGQRYVELMIDTSPTNPCPQGTPVRILPPPRASMAPPGCYLLFLVDTQGRPSGGVFVLLTS